jgi:hypothetical protein
MVKSQDELTEAGRRQSDVLIAALEKCQKLEKQLNYAVQALEMYEIQQDFTPEDYHCFAKDTLREIRDLDK